MNARALTLLLLAAVTAALGLLWLDSDSPSRARQDTEIEREVPDVTRAQAPLTDVPEAPLAGAPTSPARHAVAPKSQAGGVHVKFRDAATGDRLQPQQVRVRVRGTSIETLAMLTAKFPGGVVPPSDPALEHLNFVETGKLVTPPRDGWLDLPSGLVSISLELDEPSAHRLMPAGTTEHFVLRESKQPITFLLAKPLTLQLQVSDQFGAPASGIVLGASLALESPLSLDSAPLRVQLSERERGLWVGQSLPGRLMVKSRSPGWSGSFVRSVPGNLEECDLAGQLNRIQNTASVLLFVDGAPAETEVQLAPRRSFKWRDGAPTEWLSVAANGLLFGELSPGEYVAQVRPNTGARQGLVRKLGVVAISQGEQATARLTYVHDERTLLRGKIEGATVPLEHFTLGLLPGNAGPLAATWNTSGIDDDGKFEIELSAPGTFDLRVRYKDFGRWFHMEELRFAAHEVIQRSFIFPASAVPNPTPKARARTRDSRLDRISRIRMILEHSIEAPHRLELVDERTALMALDWLE